MTNIFGADIITDQMLKEKEVKLVESCSTTMEALYLAANPTGSSSKFDKFKSAAKSLLGKSSTSKVTNEMYNQESTEYNSAITKYYDSKKNTSISNTQKFRNLDAIGIKCDRAKSLLN